MTDQVHHREFMLESKLLVFSSYNDMPLPVEQQQLINQQT